MSVAISAQPAPSDPVSKFLAKPPRLLIDNKWVESESGKTIPVIDPATYGAAVFMVIATTVCTPPLLQWAVRRAKVNPPET